MEEGFVVGIYEGIKVEGLNDGVLVGGVDGLLDGVKLGVVVGLLLGTYRIKLIIIFTHWILPPLLANCKNYKYWPLSEDYLSFLQLTLVGRNDYRVKLT
jgi:hypothetical protein